MLDAPIAAGTSVSMPTGAIGEALGALFTLGTSTLPAERCSLYLRRNGILALCEASGTAVRSATDSVPVEGTVVGAVVRGRVPLLVQNVAAFAFLPVHPDRYATPSFISVPVLVENEVAAVFSVADRSDGQPFSEADLQRADLVARSMAAVLHSDLLARRAAGRGEVDPVSGLYNARHFEKRLAQELERAQRGRLPLSLLLLGVHSYADLAQRVDAQTAGLLMRSIGEQVAQTVRQSDVLARCADDRIAVILPATPLDKAKRVARTIAREIVSDKLPAQLRYDLEALHMSIGVAALALNVAAGDLVRRANEALQRADARGDAVVAASGEDELALVTHRTRPRAAQQHTIAAALRHGVPYLANPADAATLAAVRLLSAEVARTYVCFPVGSEAGTLTLAMAEPDDAGAIQAISQLTDMAIYPVASPRQKILQAIATLMDPPAAGTAGTAGRVRIHITAAGDPHDFATHVAQVADALDTLHAGNVSGDGVLAAPYDSPAQRDALIGGLATMPQLTIHPDSRDAALLHLRSPGTAARGA